MSQAARAVSLKPETLCQNPRVTRSACRLVTRRRKPVLRVTVRNRGVFDISKAMVVAFNGDPRKPAAPKGTIEKPIILVTRQLGHAIGPIRGLHETTFEIELTEAPPARLWVQVCTLDRHGSGEVETVAVRPQ